MSASAACALEHECSFIFENEKILQLPTLWVVQQCVQESLANPGFTLGITVSVSLTNIPGAPGDLCTCDDLQIKAAATMPWVIHERATKPEMHEFTCAGFELLSSGLFWANSRLRTTLELNPPSTKQQLHTGFRMLTDLCNSLLRKDTGAAFLLYQRCQKLKKFKTALRQPCQGTTIRANA